MTKQIEAILIDPFLMTVSAVTYSGDYRDIQKLIEASPFTVAGFGNNGDGVFVDDEGLFKDNQRFFKIAGYPQPLAGKGLILGCDVNGDSIAPTITLDEVKASIRWVMPFSRDVWLDCQSFLPIKLDDLCAA